MGKGPLIQGNNKLKVFNQVINGTQVKDQRGVLLWEISQLS